MSGVFTSNENRVSKGNLKEQLGFESTVVLTDEIPAYTLIRIRICFTSQMLELAKDAIVIGICLTYDRVDQLIISRFYARMYKLPDDEYVLKYIRLQICQVLKSESEICIKECRSRGITES